MGKAKKGKKNIQNDDFSSDDLEVGGKGNKSIDIKSKQELNEDEETEKNVTSTVPPQAKKANKKSKKKKKVESDSDNEEPDIFKQASEEDEENHPIKISKKPINKKSAFALLDVGDSDVDIDQDSSDEDDNKGKESTEVNKAERTNVETNSNKNAAPEKGSKKSKKKARKKHDEDDEDIDQLMAELELEYSGNKKVDIPVNTNISDNKSKPDDKNISNVPDDKSDNMQTNDNVVSSQEGGNKKEDSPGTEEAEEVVGTVKTAAQKKKEKKEREKQKKMQQKAHEKKKPDPAVAATQPPTEEAETKKEEETKQDEEEQATDGKKKKKKKGEVEEKKKKPGKKQLQAMQEALKEIEREKERAVQEEEARIKAEEEAEQKRLEKIRIETEKKERKKQKEKEKKERLKAEGKFLTKAQKQAKARAEASLQALRDRGFEVPAVGEKKPKPKYTNLRKTMKKKDDQSTQEAEQAAQEPEQTEISIEAPKPELEEPSAKEPDEIKDAWDVSDEEDTETPDDHETSPEKEDDEEDSDEEESESESSESESEEEENGHEVVKSPEKIKETPYERIQRRKEEAEKNKDYSTLRSPVVCVLGHVDTGKTKILDKIRRTNVQDSEAGGITQQIGATMIPAYALQEQCKMVKGFSDLEIKVPGLLVIDTPGHESFSNLRSRGSSICDMAILVVDIMHGLEPQTIESINLLKQRKTPFVIALNKVDRLYDWNSHKHRDVRDVLKLQSKNAMHEFQSKCNETLLQFSEQGLNAKLFYENDDPRKFLSVVPTSAMTGDGMGNLLGLIVELTQNMLHKQLAFSENLQSTVLEVKAIPGLGTTIDVILVNGTLREGDTIVLAGVEGPVTTQIRSLLMPQPLRELRVKNPYQEYKEIKAAQGIKLAAKDLDKAIAGLNLLVAHQPDEVDILKEEVNSAFKEVMQSIKLADRGVYVQASTLGSLEALLEFLKTSSIPYCGVRIGPVVKKDVMKASIMLEHDKEFAVILAFDVKIERDAQEMADSVGVKIFSANIIYHLFDSFKAYQQDLKQKKKEEFKHVAVFPCKLKVLPQFIFNARDPIVMGVSVEAGVIKEGTPICVPSQDFVQLGIVTTLEVNHKQIDCARKGQEICIKIEPIPGEAPKLYGRHFDDKDMLVSKISRESIDACKNYFREDLIKSDWQLIMELKKIFEIL